ncbi:MAG: hypothetical protein ACR2N3_01755 [Pyrinomonadaceae bacterium]
MPQAEIMKTTGHTQLKTFLRYVNLTMESVSSSAKKFGDFLNSKLANTKHGEEVSAQSETIN